MKTFLLTVALFAAVACAAPKSKRDVSHLLKNAEYLPPNHHHHQEHHYHEAHVQQPQYIAPQPNNQYLAPVAKAPEPVRESFQLPAATYGVPFKAAPAPAPVHVPAPVVYSAPVTSYGTPVVQTPQIHYAPAPAPVPHTTYGVPQQYQQPQQHYVQPQQHYVQPQQHYVQPQQHHQQPHQQYVVPQQQYVQPQPQYQQPQQQYVQPQQQYHQQPHQTYGVPQTKPVYVQIPAPAPAPTPVFQNTAERLVFDAPVPSVEVSHSHSVEQVPSVISAPVPAPQQEAVSVEAIGKSSNQYVQQHVGSNGGYVY